MSERMEMELIHSTDLPFGSPASNIDTTRGHISPFRTLAHESYWRVMLWCFLCSCQRIDLIINPVLFFDLLVEVLNIQRTVFQAVDQLFFLAFPKD